jgi:hypothetical protein
VRRTRVLGVGVLAAGVVATIAMAAPGTQTGPSSSEAPYVVPSQNGVITKSILTVGDSVNDKPNGDPYRMVGIPDGLGAFDNGGGTFTILMNHELGAGAGIVRAHGANGAFVSKWTIQKGSFRVLEGEDLIKQVATWNSLTSSYNAPALGVVFSRLCSADLPEKSAFWNGSLGYDGRLFMDGEEVSAGRAFAHALNGTSWELPRLGKFAWENSVASPNSGNKTVVVGLDDTTPGEVYVYVGTKTNSGSPVDRAGLTNGSLYGIRVTGFPDESISDGIPSGTPFSLFSFGNVENMTAAQLQTASDGGDVTQFRRPEDGAWDTQDPNVFYFVTTASFNEESRLWRLTFNDVNNPAAGGTIDMLLEDNEEGHHMFDNITVDSRGRVLLNEDPGGQPYLARIWQYDPESDSLTEIAHFDPDRFVAGGSGFLTQDEESSGIIDVSSILGEGTFLSDVQAHYGIPGELVEGGQLFAIRVPPGKFK